MNEPQQTYHVLGLDPGSRVMGYAVLRCEGKLMTAVDIGVLRLHETQDHPDRLERIFDLVSSLILEYSPSAVAVETPVYGKDPLAMLKLGRAQAACILAARLKSVPIDEYYPKMVKKSVTGNGNSSKDQVAYMLERTVKLTDVSLPRDATDALAVAWCHVTQKRSSAAPIPVVKRRAQDKKHAWSDFLSQHPERIHKA
jgi:crossover junction endodeoxyribonuclease RuvC